MGHTPPCLPLATLLPGLPLVTLLPGLPLVTLLPGLRLATLLPGLPLVTLLPGLPLATLLPGLPLVTLLPGLPLVTLLHGLPFVALLVCGSCCPAACLSHHVGWTYTPFGHMLGRFRVDPWSTCMAGSGWTYTPLGHMHGWCRVDLHTVRPHARQVQGGPAIHAPALPCAALVGADMFVPLPPPHRPAPNPLMQTRPSVLASGVNMPIIAFLITGGLLLPLLLLTHAMASGATMPIIAFLITGGMLLPTATCLCGCVLVWLCGCVVLGFRDNRC